MKTDLPQRMRSAADILQEVGALFGYPLPQYVGWSPDSLRHEADQLEKDVPA